MVKTHGFPVKIFPTKPIHWAMHWQYTWLFGTPSSLTNKHLAVSSWIIRGFIYVFVYTVGNQVVETKLRIDLYGIIVILQPCLFGRLRYLKTMAGIMCSKQMLGCHWELRRIRATGLQILLQLRFHAAAWKLHALHFLFQTKPSGEASLVSARLAAEAFQLIQPQI